MSIVSKTFFAVKCDNCGKYSGEGSGYEFWVDIESTELSAEYGGYIKQGDNHYCDDCWEHDDDDNLIIKNKQV